MTTVEPLELTDRARRVLRAAQEHAVKCNHDYIGTDNILAALIRDEGYAAQILKEFGITEQYIDRAISKYVPTGNDPNG